MIVRDNLGFIIQHPRGYLEGGDSSRSTGLMSMSGSEIDSLLLPDLEKDGLLTRHPEYNPNSFTRDQLLPVIAGLYVSSQTSVAKRVFWSHAKRGFFCQNSHDIYGNKKGPFQRDILNPAHIGALAIAARIYPLYLLAPIAWVFLFFDIVWHSVYSYREQNQIISLVRVYGKFWTKLYTKINKKWVGGTNSYWSGWRDQKEIGEKIVESIKDYVR